ncbi:hypothetical protein [Methylobacterium sp. J-067]|uniref:hypothetical protein n=1 Tax=Methylobacterium sp. J-067 TaxID=2836648 RepID=UPI001FBBB595|nr:hypothetical protein [Methylobacterium sp. J-067]MCJ2023382.1 hypothetical protein [Methylobacterium sp. J-067]
MDCNTTPLADRLAEAKIDTLKEIIRNAESFLSGQLTSGLASNQRALTLTSVLAAATVVLGGATATLLVGATPNPPLAAICGLVTAGFLVSMGLAISAAKPADWYLAGNTPASWVEDVELGKILERSLAEQASWYADMIADNHATMERADDMIILALEFAWGSIAMGCILCGVLSGLLIN